MLSHKHVPALAAGMFAVVLTGGCGAAAWVSSPARGIALVAYSTPQKAYERLLPAFRQTSAGAGAQLAASYGASGTQRNKVLAGQPADVVEFSRSADMDKLVSAHLVATAWSSGPHRGMVTDSLVTLIVRKGNPLHITRWADLLRPGVKVVTPNPLSSGSACWNLMAVYGAQLHKGRGPVQALAFVRQLLEHTVSQPASGAEATATFVSGTGDVLIGYENEAIEAQQAGAPVDYVTPPDTLLIENPIAVTTHAANRALDEAFVAFLYSDTAQRIFASEGYRPVVGKDLDPQRFPTPSGLFTIASLGGWTAVDRQFFDPSKGSITLIEKSLGRGVSG